MSEPVLTLEGVHVHVPRRADPVLRGVDLQVAPGEHVLLLGPSGSGKSTLVQCLTGVIPRSVAARLDGHVTVAGASTKDSSVVELSRHVGVLAQDPAAAVCLPHVTHELALPLENHAADPSCIGQRIDAALGAVGAAHLRDRRTGKLSGGETQRVALAAALVTEPEVLVLDEPTSMLDPAGVRAVRDALAAVTTRKGPAVVLVEHRLDELAGDEGLGGLPARTLVLAEDGSVMADGPTRDVLHRHGRALLRAGCWLPLESELRALTGADGGLSATKNQELLLHLATASRPRPDDLLDEPVRFGPPVLRARSLAVSGQDERRRRRSPGGPPPLLTGVDVEVRAGEVLAVLGPNGAGKSSLLLTLAGLRAPAGGTVEGERAGMVFQNPEHQMVASTVAEEIAHGLGADRAGHRDIDAIVARQLREHRLTHLAHQNPFRLSGGEKRRVSLAAMLAHERPCLLADEPTLGLDRRDTLATIATLRRAARAGHGVVIVSHDLRTVAALADTVLVLAEGGVAAYGLTVEVLRDAHVLRRAGLTLPGVLAWLLEHVADPAGVRRALRELDATVPLPDPQLAGVAG